MSEILCGFLNVYVSLSLYILHVIYFNFAAQERIPGM